jgi:hypothetical protein
MPKSWWKIAKCEDDSECKGDELEFFFDSLELIVQHPKRVLDVSGIEQNLLFLQNSVDYYSE